MYIEKLYFVAEDCTAVVSTTEQPAGTTTKNIETTTEAPTTKVRTTEPPETTTKNNETTTEAPTTKMATTTMAPEPSTPKPGSPDINIYTARNSTSDAACLMIKAGIEFVIPYVAKAGVSR